MGAGASARPSGAFFGRALMSFLSPALPPPGAEISSSSSRSMGALSAPRVVEAGSAGGAAGGGGGAFKAACSWLKLVSLLGTAAMTSPVSVTVGRSGITGVPSVASNASGAPAMRESFTFFQSSPERLCTMPQACRSLPPLSITSL
jgi:hypothetical protein